MTSSAHQRGGQASRDHHDCSITMPGSPTSSHLHHFHHCPPLSTPHHWMTAKATEEPRAVRGALASMQRYHITLLDDQKCAQERRMPTDRYDRHAGFTNIHPTPPRTMLWTWPPTPPLHPWPHHHPPLLLRSLEDMRIKLCCGATSQNLPLHCTVNPLYHCHH